MQEPDTRQTSLLIPLLGLVGLLVLGFTWLPGDSEAQLELPASDHTHEGSGADDEGVVGAPSVEAVPSGRGAERSRATPGTLLMRAMSTPVAREGAKGSKPDALLRVRGSFRAPGIPEAKGIAYLLLQRKGALRVIDATPFRVGSGFILEHAETGPLEVWARLSGHDHVQWRITVDQPGRPEHDLGELSLGPGVDLIGRIGGIPKDQPTRCEVSLIQVDGRRSMTALDENLERSQKTTADSRGQFRFVRVPPGHFVLVARLQGFAACVERIHWIEEPPAGGRVYLRLRRGRVFRGLVVDTKGATIEQAKVQFTSREHKLDETRASTDAKGQFMAMSFDQGIAIRIEKEGYQPLVIPDHLISKTEKVFRMRKGREVEGWVSTSTGAACSLASVLIRSADSPPRIERTHRITDTEGHFIFEGLPDGKYVIEGMNSRRGSAVIHCRVPNPRPLQLWLPNPVQVVFEVVDDRGKALDGARVLLRKAGAWNDGRELLPVSSLTVDRAGQASFEVMQGATVFWSVQDIDAVAIESGRLEVRSTHFRRVVYSQRGAFEGVLDARALPSRILGGGLALELRLGRKGEPLHVPCTPDVAGRHRFAVKRLPKGRYFIRLLTTPRRSVNSRLLAEAKAPLVIHPNVTRRFSCTVVLD